MKSLIVTLLSLFSVVSANAEGENISDSLRTQRELFPQEKVYVMTDREMYTTGDTIWFRGWVLDGETLKEKQMSRFLYVELRDPASNLVNRVRIMVDKEGVYQGYLPVDVNLSSNQYSLVAYTYYMLGTNETYYFKKPLDIMKPDDLLSGVLPKALKDRVYPQVYTDLQPGSNQPFVFDVPANGKYAVSVTSFTHNPSYESAFITNNLPKQPNLFEESDVVNKTTYIVPTYPYEQGTVLSGTVYGNFNYKRPQKETLVSAVAFRDSVNYVDTMTDEKGHFELPLPECQDSTVFMVQAFKKKSAKYNIEFDKSVLPEKVAALPVSPDHFVRVAQKTEDDGDFLKWALAMKNNQAILLNEVVVKEKKIEPLYEYHQSTHSKIFTNEESNVFTTYTQILAQIGVFANKYHGHEIIYYFDGIRVPPEDINIGTLREMRDEDKLGSFYPPSMVRAVELLNPDEAMAFSERMGPDKYAYVVNFILKKGRDIAMSEDLRSNYKPYIPFYAQKPLRFTGSPSSSLLYWDTSVKSGADGKLHLSFPMFSTTIGTYRITVEGIGPNGELVHQEQYVRTNN